MILRVKKNRILTILFLSTFLIIVFISCSEYFQRTSRIVFQSPIMELEPRLLIDKADVYFSASNGYTYNLYKYSHRTLTRITNANNDILYPFLFKSHICGLQDHNGEENFKPTDSDLVQLTKGKSIRSLYSFEGGNLIYILFKGEGKLYEFNLKKMTQKVVLDNVQRLNGVAISIDKQTLSVSCDNKLLCIKLNAQRQVCEIENGPLDEPNKTDPFFDKNRLIFSSNRNSEYYNIYAADLSTQIPKVTLLFHSDHDLLMPKVFGNDLYFLELTNSEYLLRCLNLKTGVKTAITKKGVVYNYEKKDAENIICTYSDDKTPKSLLNIRLSDNYVSTIVGGPIKTNVQTVLIPSTNVRSQGFSLYSLALKEKRGVILFFHPGVHADYSPRWDVILNNLASNGFLVIAPNYPGSIGFGKFFLNDNIDKINDDIFQWHLYIAQNFGQLPVYYLSMSSGNLIMLQALKMDIEHNIRTVSICGIPDYHLENQATKSLYILGENDPYIPFFERESNLMKLINVSQKDIFSISGEGHWLRKRQNQVAVVQRISDWYIKPNFLNF